MPSGRRRLDILCEDRRTERFVRRLCERYGVTVFSVSIAPNGRGDASVWVKSQYARFVRKRRSKNFQQNLGLLVVVDGDRLGAAARHNELESKLEEEHVERRQRQEPTAVFVPTWSIETWLAHLCGKPGVVESKSLKEESSLRSLWDEGPAEAATIRQAVAAWNGPAVTLPSLADAYDEARRVGLL